MKSILKATFQGKYSHDRFKTFLAEMFQKSASEFDFQKVFPEKDTEKYYDTRHLLSFQTDDKKTIEVLSVELQTKGNVENARGYQRRLIEKYIKNRIHQNKWVDGVLVTFWSEFDSSWRLSFVTMDLKDGKKEFSPFKRHSFLVGKHEATHTAEQQFYEVLKSKKTPLYTQLQEVFSVEKVTDDFFEEYKKHFLSLNTKFLENKVFQESVVEAQGVKNADFVKKLMGQIVFLYFLQKKGWMGVSQGEKWGSGNKNFMRDLLNECLEGGDSKKERSGKNFFNDYLEHLFYDTLNNKDRGGASVAGDYSWSSYFQCRIPYLNGGLFEPVYEWKKTFIDIPNSLFEGLFDTFDRYNFTVYESDSLETDVAVDPEMLGKVFENLLEIDERKGKGAFYTPREIVHYMCQESLINYLTNTSGYEESRIRTLMERKDEVTAKSEAEKKSIEENQDLKDMAVVINDLLKNVTVCDPAVGSGAFPMGMLKEIVSLRFFLNRHFVKAQNEKTGKTLNEYDIKKETLENCIYGVDIEPGAIEICRLRFWLSMVVEHDIEEVEPLPNLDYKLMQGNSLLENLVIGDSVIKLNIDTATKGDKRTKEMKNLLEVETQGALFSLDSNTEVVDKLQKLHIEFFDETDPEKKKVLKNKIDEYENLFIETACNDEINRLQSVIRNSDDKKKDKAEKQITLIEQTLKKWKKDHIRPFFPWKLHFGEIFKDGGFDIVIANPPYVGIKGNSKLFKPIKLSKFGKYMKGRSELIYLFFHLSMDIAKKNGNMSFITTNYFLNATDAKLLREEIKKKTNILSLVDFNELKIFKSALGQHNIITNLINSDCYDKKAKTAFVNLKGIATPEILKSIINRKNNHTKYFKVKQNDFYYSENNYISVTGTGAKNSDKIISKILDGTPLIEIAHVRQGMRTGIDKLTEKHLQKINNLGQKDDGVFVLKKSELKKLRLTPEYDKIIKPFFKNSDVSSYYTKSSTELSVIYTTTQNTANYYAENFTKIYEHLVKYKEIISAIRGKNNEKVKNWYALDRPREKFIFESEKIVAPQRSKRNTFGYNNSKFYTSADVYYILTKDADYSLKYILTLLNSSLYFYWLIKRGKRKGDMLELYQKPLSEIPIKRVSIEDQKPFIDIVDQILEITKQENYDPKHPPEEQKELEAEIDEMVFDLYGLTEEEKEIVLNT